MKANKVLLGIFCCLLSVTASPQQKCNVLRKDISGEYIGECKKELAHGLGLAKGENTYEGDYQMEMAL